MAKLILLTFRGTTSRFDFFKVDRAKLYGQRTRVPLDPEDQRCQRAELTHDGAFLLRRGMTAQGYFGEEGRWYASRDLVGVDGDGAPVEQAPSTLGQAQDLEGPVEPSQLLDLHVSSVYALDPHELDEELKVALDGGAIFRFPFNYRTDWRLEHAFLVANDEGIFALVGQPGVTEWCELAQAVPDTGDDDDGLEEELDFEMF